DVADGDEHHLGALLPQLGLHVASSSPIRSQKPQLGLQLTSRICLPLKSSRATERVPSRSGSSKAGTSAPVGSALGLGGLVASALTPSSSPARPNRWVRLVTSFRITSGSAWNASVI